MDSRKDVVIEKQGEGTDTVRSSVNHTLAANVENLVLTGTQAIRGEGNALDNQITGNGRDNVLNGGAGNDTLDGGAGNDRLAGGTGDDTFIVDSAGDRVKEKAGEGIDTVKSSVSHVLAANVENLVLTGTADLRGTGNALNNVITGNSGNNRLNGRGGDDRMEGGAGNDTYVVNSAGDVVIERANEGTDTVRSAVSYRLGDHLENLVLTGWSAIDATGNGLNNRLTGNRAANMLDGGAGDDVMAGKEGNDTYIVDSAGDVVVEGRNAGKDTVKASVTYALSANVENLVLTGSSAINGSGNALNNTLTGNSASNILTGGRGHDTFVFTGLIGADTITDFSAGKGRGDVLQLSLGTAFDSFAEIIAAANEVGGSTVFDFGTFGSITLEGVRLSSLAADDVVFV